MSKHQKDLTIEKLMDKIKTYITDENELSVIDKAYKYAYEKHFGQKRLTGEEYIIHPLNVAYILTRISADYETLRSRLMMIMLVVDCKQKHIWMKKCSRHIMRLLLIGFTLTIMMLLALLKVPSITRFIMRDICWFKKYESKNYQNRYINSRIHYMCGIFQSQASCTKCRKQRYNFGYVS